MNVITVALILSKAHQSSSLVSGQSEIGRVRFYVPGKM